MTVEKLTKDDWLYVLKHFVKYLVVLIIGIVIGLGQCSVLAPQKDNSPIMRDSEKKAHKRLLIKHGLAWDVAVIHRDMVGQYFIRDGKRCEFK